MASKAALGKQHVCFGPLWIGAQNTFPPNMLYVCGDALLCSPVCATIRCCQFSFQWDLLARRWLVR